MTQVEVRRCCCGARMVRWSKSTPWFCPRCIFRLTAQQEKEGEDLR
jgi:hypothetical protein